jgi:hypothetical protein
MNDPELNAIFARARLRRVDTSRQKYAFETRVMARIKEEGEPSVGAIWAKVSWRMFPIFATCVLALAILQSHMDRVTDETSALSALENPEGIVLSGSLN